MSKYIVGLLVGGLMEDPELRVVEPLEVIEAVSAHRAEEIYNKMHDCSYFYAMAFCEDGKLVKRAAEVTIPKHSHLPTAETRCRKSGKQQNKGQGKGTEISLYISRV